MSRLRYKAYYNNMRDRIITTKKYRICNVPTHFGTRISVVKRGEDCNKSVFIDTNSIEFSAIIASDEPDFELIDKFIGKFLKMKAFL